jgi:hypothetical protein
MDEERWDRRKDLEGDDERYGMRRMVKVHRMEGIKGRGREKEWRGSRKL